MTSEFAARRGSRLTVRRHRVQPESVPSPDDIVRLYRTMMATPRPALSSQAGNGSGFLACHAVGGRRATAVWRRILQL
ncbi:hypothetical protein BHAP_0288 [Bifidobacterium hapali]|uniref:Uncharacterized protein n=1 Tax=Bifidobacterium hapali TaxID=1630172 RepID=A0A261G5Z3_9BIFI|nr:hypothetical protein BHAP_0288 [Bifidobacterium hapali]